jgi:hypothetical protein
MLGSAAEPVAVCDIAVPLGPHRSSAIDVLATAGLNSDENLIAKLPHAGTADSTPERQDITFPSELGHCGFKSGR